jgi:hypothetical protein
MFNFVDHLLLYVYMVIQYNSYTMCPAPAIFLEFQHVSLLKSEHEWETLGILK